MINHKSKLSKQKKSVDKKLLFLILGFVVIGLIGVADVSAPQSLAAYGDKFFLFKQQLEWAGLGLIVFFATSKIKYTFWEKLATLFFLLSLVLLAIVLLPHLGFSALGARRWIFSGPLNFQPSEIVKFAICVYFAKVASRTKGAMSYFIPLAIVAVLNNAAAGFGNNFDSYHYRSFADFCIQCKSLVFTGRIGNWWSGGIPLILFSPYRKQRLLTFLQMTEDPLGKVLPYKTSTPESWVRGDIRSRTWRLFTKIFIFA